MPADFEKRIADIEDRLARIESRLGGTVPQAQAPAQVQTAAPVLTRASKQPETSTGAPLPEPQDHPALVTSILGWGGAVAFALAASYLIRLAIDTGWLTPVRQVAFAAIAGLVLVPDLRCAISIANTRGSCRREASRSSFSRSMADTSTS
jgi:uncharacterized membrane protein